MALLNRCSVCPKGAGTCFCPGCKTYFCDDDFKDHRATLFNKLIGLTGDRDALQDKISTANSKKQFDSSLLSRIDEWQKDTIKKVEQVADQARQHVVEIMNSKRDEMTSQFQAMSQELAKLTETKGVVEQDLIRLKQQIDQLNNDLEQLCKPLVIELNVKQSEDIVWDRMIYLKEKSGVTTYQRRRPQPKGEHLNRFCSEFFKHRLFYELANLELLVVFIRLE